MNHKYLSAAAAVIAALSLTACQQSNADHEPKLRTSARIETPASAEPSALLAVATVFASDRGHDWNAYAALPQIAWTDSAPTEQGPGVYFRQGTLLLRGFTVEDVPNGVPGMEHGTVRRNEGQSTLTLIGSQTEVSTVAISKPFYSDDYAAILHNQLGAAPQLVTIADQCAPAPYDEGTGPGAFFELSIPGRDIVYARASQQDGGKYTAGFTVFELTRTHPSQAMAELGCKQPK
ncbi:hypothetical protein [Lysobacter antibioticus]|uniref:Lipoprotein n=1 Tax=Lysobacter antibioticus TaxID=84531 RepID=A0A0S2FCM3_LYSAN|nr:hypothetical protein [Lysobacter antibioticus]ALN81291.1 hypothetical protein LA76x_3163 [Lysobacter antibioticus]